MSRSVPERRDSFSWPPPFGLPANALRMGRNLPTRAMTYSIDLRFHRCVVSKFLGVPVLRKEDPALLSGRGRYADDLPVPAGTLHAHVIRSPHAHAKIVGIDAGVALAQDGVWAVVTGEDVRQLSEPFLIALKAPINQWSLAVERVRYVGEPVALVVADTRYLAEDAADLVRIDYEPLDAVIDPQAARTPSEPLIHPHAKSNEISVRKFSYGDTKGAFEQAHARVALACTYPRNAVT